MRTKHSKAIYVTPEFHEYLASIAHHGQSLGGILQELFDQYVIPNIDKSRQTPPHNIELEGARHDNNTPATISPE